VVLKSFEIVEFEKEGETYTKYGLTVSKIFSPLTSILSKLG
jgi:hypothetical protein